ncbi:MAG: EVE domain-containing protein [Rhodospirillaceae bacterium]|jgi:predicted RNA-binding protein with PUA-like domain|nr:EVE domain-containing protein [Rhodospirillaceae bacterium]MBT6138451.1 EVE domain-containing protein [Rhodospirillaceae bacterium]
MAYWLFKSEPGAWSWDDQVAAGKKGDDWDGVRNHQAANNMKAMKVGDLGFFYHSVNEKRVVGIVEVCKEYHADPTDASGRFGMVCVRAIEPMPEPVTLADIKAEETLEDLALVRQSRLSVVPVDARQWKIICKMGGLKK